MFLALLLAAAAPPASWQTTAADLAAVATWPVRLERGELVAMGGLAAGSAALFAVDTRLYKDLGRVTWTMRHRSVFNRTLLLGDGLVDALGLGAFALGGERGRRTARAGLESLCAVGLTSVLLKHVFRVARPQADPADKSYFAAFHNDAFPSGHTASAFAAAAVISANYPSAAPFAYGAAGLVGLSVMKRGWHWPSDVLAGAGLGILIARVSLRVNAF